MPSDTTSPTSARRGADVASISAHRASTERPAPVTFAKLHVDVIIQHLLRVHDRLSALPLDGLDVKCGACGADLVVPEGGPSRLVCDAVLELEDVIARLGSAR
ncbi:MAG: hypothetical protein QM736_20520 [Vicinamibacterales bacterium]